MNPESSSGIYVTASVESECKLIAQNWNMKEVEKIKMIRINALKRSSYMNQRRKLLVKLARQPPNFQMTWWLLRTPPPPSSKSSYTYQPASSGNPISILVEIWGSCLIRRSGQSRRRLCRSGVKGSGWWEVMCAYCENSEFCDAWWIDTTAVVIL